MLTVHNNKANYKNKKQLNFFVFIIIFLSPITGAGIDIYVTSISQIATYFHTNISIVRFTIVFYLLFYGLSLPFVGAITDSKGRRNVLLGGLLVFTIASLMAPFSKNIYFLIIFRAIQGVAVAVPSVVTKAIMCDIFKGEQLKRCATYNMIAWASGPILAPLIGGYLQHYFGWHSVFYFMGGYSLIAILIVLFNCPETLANKQPLAFAKAVTIYRTILSNKVFVSLAFILTLLYSFIVVFNIQGPYIVQNILHLSAINYGHYALFLGLAWLLGSITSRSLINRVSFHAIVYFCFSSCFLVSSFMLFIVVFLPIHLMTLLVNISLLFYFGAILFSAAYGQCLSSLPHLGGSLSATLASFYIIGTSFTSFISSLFKSQSQIPLALTYMMLTVVGIIAYKLMMGPRVKQKPQGLPEGN